MDINILEMYITNSEGGYDIVYCKKSERENQNIPYSEAKVSPLDFHEHASRMYQPTYVIDSCNAGEIIQHEYKSKPFKEFVSEDIDDILQDFINSKHFKP